MSDSSGRASGASATGGAGTSGPRGPYAKTAERRGEIIATATAVFSAHGYQGGSLRQIAKQLDLSLTTVMHHFPTKVSLLAAVLDQEDRADPGSHDRSRRDGFIPMVLGIVTRNLRRRELVRMFSIVSAEATYPQHEAHEWLVARYANVTAEYAELIAHDREAGRIAADQPAELLAELVIRRVGGHPDPVARRRQRSGRGDARAAGSTAPAGGRRGVTAAGGASRWHAAGPLSTASAPHGGAT